MPIAEPSRLANACVPRIPAGSGVRLKVAYEYDSTGFLEKVYNHANPAEVYWEALDMDVWGHVEQEQFGNGLTTTHMFDQATGLMESIKTNDGGANDVQDLAYQWDALGNLTQRHDARLGLTEDFMYDSLNRLNLVTLNTSTVTLDPEYDMAGLGNLVSGRPSLGTYSYGAGTAGPHALTATAQGSYGYDLNGNMENRAGTSITWTSFNAPKLITADAANSSEFFYDPFRARTRQVAVINGVVRTTDYVGGLFERVQVGGTTEYRHKIFADGREVLTYVRRGMADGSYQAEMQYLHRDHLGSVDAVTNQSGQVIARMSFDAFGQRRNPATWQGSPSDVGALTAITTRGYTDHEMLDHLGLIHMNGRVYDPELGRFLSADPFVQAPLFSQSYNRYSYTFNNPLTFVDPSGYMTDDDPEPGYGGCGDRPNSFCFGIANSVLGFGIPGGFIELVWAPEYFRRYSGANRGLYPILRIWQDVLDYIASLPPPQPAPPAPPPEPAVNPNIDYSHGVELRPVTNPFTIVATADVPIVSRSLRLIDASVAPLLGIGRGIFTGDFTPFGPLTGLTPTTEELKTTGVLLAATGPVGLFRGALVRGAGIVASNGTRITGLTRHGVQRAIGNGAERAGTRPRAILDALKNPKRIVEGVDSQGRPFQIFHGTDARVVVNPQTGKIVSTNPLSEAGAL